jgi:hypothetical protein
MPRQPLISVKAMQRREVSHRHADANYLLTIIF